MTAELLVLGLIVRVMFAAFERRSFVLRLTSEDSVQALGRASLL